MSAEISAQSDFTRRRPSDEVLIDIKGINKHFGTNHVLKGVDLQVHKGEVVVVIGPSGSGKSTLCRCINRLERFQSGSIDRKSVV